MIQRMLAETAVQTAHFGTGGAKSLDEFANEIKSGEASLMLDVSNYKRLVRAVDVVLLRISCGSGSTKTFLVQESEFYADGRGRTNENILPGMKKAPYENIQATTHRIV